MSGKKGDRIDTDDRSGATHNPFASLRDLTGLPDGPEDAPPEPEPPAPASRGRVDIVRQTAGRGGKVVTVLQNFEGVTADELRELAKTLRQACGTGGTCKDGTIEIQGDHRETVSAALEAQGFRPVFAGG